MRLKEKPAAAEAEPEEDAFIKYLNEVSKSVNTGPESKQSVLGWWPNGVRPKETNGKKPEASDSDGS